MRESDQNGQFLNIAQRARLARRRGVCSFACRSRQRPYALLAVSCLLGDKRVAIRAAEIQVTRAQLPTIALAAPVPMDTRVRNIQPALRTIWRQYKCPTR